MTHLLDKHAMPARAYRASILFAATCAVLAMTVLPGCAAAGEAQLGVPRTYNDDLRVWQCESERWMASFEEMAPGFSRNLPQLEPDSAFSRHIAALSEFGSHLEGPSVDRDALIADHAKLGRVHEELRLAYGNMVRLAEERSRASDRQLHPEIADDVPH